MQQVVGVGGQQATVQDLLNSKNGQKKSKNLDFHHHHQQLQQSHEPQKTPQEIQESQQSLDDIVYNKRRRMRMKSSAGGGEIIQVQGGHIVRSTGRKDRHSKVYTTKGPRDRRVRLSAHTAIQFYDVQDRLGYDRPSKAVDWLINKAQSAIDKLARLPPWNPTAGAADVALPEQSELSSGYNFVPQTLDLDGMKSFFPASSSVSSSVNFQSYPPEIIPRTSNEDLCLSLHSFQDQTNHHFAGGGGSSPVSFEPSFQRMVSWGSEQEENRGGGFMFGSPPPPQQSVLFSSQREPLQSSFGAQSSVRAWDDIPMASAGDRGSFGLPEFCLPTQIHGQDELREDSDHKPSSSSPISRH